jgi:hypothetical protein
MRMVGGAMLAGRAARSDARASRTYCLFSKHLPELGWADLGRAVKDAGFDGVDLTVRPGGHVLPERAADDLPRLVEALGLPVAIVPGDATNIKVTVPADLVLAGAIAATRANTADRKVE